MFERKAGIPRGHMQHKCVLCLENKFDMDEPYCRKCQHEIDRWQDLTANQLKMAIVLAHLTLRRMVAALGDVK